MGFEDPKFISEFVVLNPEDTDQRAQGAITMRSIKNAIVGTGTVDAGSFTPNATGQYTGTMDELQAMVDDGLTTASVIDDLADVDTGSSPPVAGDLLHWDGADWVPGGSTIYSARYDGLAGFSTNEVFFSSEVQNDIPVELATIDNTGATTGWRLTVVERLCINISPGYTATANGGLSVKGAVSLNPPDTSQPPPGVNRPAYMADTSDIAGTGVGVAPTASMVLEIGDVVAFSVIAGTNFTSNDATMTLTVQAVA
jgi:hypothetical protein